MNYYFDATMVLLVPAALLAMWAQYNIKATFHKYSNHTTQNGLTAAKVAEKLLYRAGLLNIPVQKVSGNLTDHYDPIKKTINLSDSVYGNSSIAALGVAAHECGHAIQHSVGYSPLMIRNAIVPMASLSSNLAIPVFFAGLLLSMANLMMLGIILFAGAVFFHLVTLPVEFNASTRALTMLHDTGTLSGKELQYARSVLRAASWTYIATAAIAIIHLIRFIILKNRR